MSFRVLALIAARAGSKGLRNKNVRRVAGVPLLARAIDLALSSRRRGEAWRVVVSTDSENYARLAHRAGAEVPFMRPKRLATDGSRLIDVVLHAIDALGGKDAFDAILLLSATTPLTTVRDVRGAIDSFRDAGRGEKPGQQRSVASVMTDPYDDSWRFVLRDGRLSGKPAGHRVEQRARHPDAVVLNGAIYLATPQWLHQHQQFVVPGRTEAYLMPPQRCLDIETTEDLARADYLLHRR